MRLVLLTIAILALAGPSMAQPLSQRDIEALAPTEVTRRALGQLGDQLVYAGEGQRLARPSTLQQLYFRGPPRPSTTAGFCQKDTLAIHYRPASQPAGRVTPGEITGFTTLHVYAALADHPEVRTCEGLPDPATVYFWAPFEALAMDGYAAFGLLKDAARAGEIKPTCRGQVSEQACLETLSGLQSGKIEMVQPCYVAAAPEGRWSCYLVNVDNYMVFISTRQGGVISARLELAPLI